MNELPEEFFKDIPMVSGAVVPGTVLSAALQAAKDAVQPDRSRQGPVFFVGEELEIKGGRFQVTRIEPGHLRLKSLPATDSKPRK
jgi:hypothetical protein